MKPTPLPTAILLGLTFMWSAAIRAAGSDAPLARPGPAQYAWHEQERIMFVHFGVATWEGTEYDADGKTDLSKMNPTGFNAEEICAAAQSWGARQILLVCKHVVKGAVFQSI